MIFIWSPFPISLPALLCYCSQHYINELWNGLYVNDICCNQHMYIHIPEKYKEIKFEVLNQIDWNFYNSYWTWFLRRQAPEPTILLMPRCLSMSGGIMAARFRMIPRHTDLVTLPRPRLPLKWISLTWWLIRPSVFGYHTYFSIVVNKKNTIFHIPWYNPFHNYLPLFSVQCTE